MFVGCKLPHGHKIEHNNQVIELNGANVGYDGDSPWKNGFAPDSPLRASGVGLTRLEGAQADAFLDWADLTGKGLGPVKAGLIFFVDKETDAKKEAAALEGAKTGLDGLDPTTDLPAGLSTDTDKKG